MKILICDDSSNAIKELRGLIDKFSVEQALPFDIVEVSDPKKIINCCDNFDLAFLDIEMPEINGLSLTKYLKSKNPNIIVFIVTSFNAYLDDAMDLNVFRYLSKPVNEQRFNKSLHTAINLLKQNSEAILIEAKDGCHTVYTSDILYIAINSRKTKVVTSRTEYICNQNLEKWKTLLKSKTSFSQPHYSFIVNMKNVTDFNRNEIILSLNSKTEAVPVSRGHYEKFRKDFFAYMGVTV